MCVRAFLCVCVRACVCVRVCACVRVCVWVWVWWLGGAYQSNLCGVVARGVVGETTSLPAGKVREGWAWQAKTTAGTKVAERVRVMKWSSAEGTGWNGEEAGVEVVGGGRGGEGCISPCGDVRRTRRR